MDTRINKPKVFLSHSSKDKPFIERIYNDLKKCQIEPWLDSEDIRHGKSWLDSIFEDSIPTCDAVLVYLTNDSIESQMVKREMDVAVLEQLKDKKVAFLPYISESNIRDKIRADIQTRHTPVWNNDNYLSLLPKVISEIWLSYLERTIDSALKDEKIKRLEAELIVEKLKKESSSHVFANSEEIEFNYIWNEMDKYDIFEVQEMIEITKEGSKPQIKNIGVKNMKVKRNNLVAIFIGEGRIGLNLFDMKLFLEDMVNKDTNRQESSPKTKYEVIMWPNIDDQLLMFGFIERIHHKTKHTTDPFKAFVYLGPSYQQVWTPKSYRFRYWLAYNKMLSDKLDLLPS